MLLVIIWFHISNNRYAPFYTCYVFANEIAPLFLTFYNLAVVYCVTLFLSCRSCVTSYMPNNKPLESTTFMNLFSASTWYKIAHSTTYSHCKLRFAISVEHIDLAVTQLQSNFRIGQNQNNLRTIFKISLTTLFVISFSLLCLSFYIFRE